MQSFHCDTVIKRACGVTPTVIVKANCLYSAPTHDAYLDNGVDIGLTVDKNIIVLLERYRQELLINIGFIIKEKHK